MKIKQSPEEIINSLEGIGRAEPSPYFYTRLQAKMAREDNGFVISYLKLLMKPSYSIAVAVLFILINGYFLMTNVSQEKTFDETTQNIAAEYVQQNLNPYDNLIETP
jgi:hypothetical protein